MDKHHRKYNTETGLQNFILRLQEKNPNINYYKNYKDSESKVTLKCNKCGNIFERYASCVRQNKTIRCYECEKIKTKNKKEFIKKQKQINKELLNKANRLLNNKQVTFSICNHCGILFYTVNKKIYCSNRCANRHHEHKHSRQRIDNARKNGQVDYTITLDKLIKRDNNICYICNKECNLNDYTYINNTKVTGNYYPSIDHVIPLAKSGTHSWDNVRLAHRICNTLKSDKAKPLGE